MFKNIVVPLDGSELSEKAIPYAVRLSKALNLNLSLVRVVEEPDLPAFPLHVKPLEEATAYLNSVKKLLIDGPNGYSLTNQIEVEILAGEAAEGIQRYVISKEDPLVVMTTHGRSGFSRFVTGSVAASVLHKLSTPALLVRPIAQEETAHDLQKSLDTHPEPYANTFLKDGVGMLVTVDQSAKSEMALTPAFELAKQLKANIFFLKVNPPIENIIYAGVSVTNAFADEDIAKLEEQEREVAQAYLVPFIEKAHVAGVEATAKVITGDPTKEIMKYAKLVEPDLIVMATHARGEMGQLFFGSVANRVLKITHLPILMVPTRHKA